MKFNEILKVATGRQNRFWFITQSFAGIDWARLLLDIKNQTVAREVDLPFHTFLSKPIFFSTVLKSMSIILGMASSRVKIKASLSAANNLELHPNPIPFWSS